MASWTMSPGFMVSFRLLEMLFMGARRPAGGGRDERVIEVRVEVERERVKGGGKG